MTNTEKRSLYESIMNDVAKTVKRHLNESNGNPFTRRLQYLLDHEDEMSDLGYKSGEEVIEYAMKLFDERVSKSNIRILGHDIDFPD